jgi:hypothetical protein
MMNLNHSNCYRDIIEKKVSHVFTPMILLFWTLIKEDFVKICTSSGMKKKTDPHSFGFSGLILVFLDPQWTFDIPDSIFVFLDPQ